MRLVGLTERAVRTIRLRHERGEGYRRIAHDFGVHWLTVKYHVKRGAMRVHPIRPSTFDETLPLFPTAGGHRPLHRVRNAKKIEASLTQCDRLLAEQRKAETPRWRRCERCDGIEDTTHPHAHKEAA